MSLVKFDAAYPYGDKHDEFAKVAVDGAESNGLFVGEVGIKDYGEKDNEELANRFKVLKEEFPVVYAFKKDPAEGGKVKQFRFDGTDFTAANIKAFLRDKTGHFLPVAGCIQELDKMALEASKGETPADWGQVAENMNEFIETLTDAKEKKKGSLYVKIIKKILSDGDDFPEKEIARTKKVLKESKVTEEKKKQMNEKINVLLSFVKPKDKDEL